MEERVKLNAWKNEEHSTRERILRVASQMFARKGYTGTSTREIANEIGIRQPSMFHHFASKRAILETLLSYSVDDASIEARRAAESKGPAAVRLYRFLVRDTEHLSGSPYDLSGLHVTEVMSDPSFAVWNGRLDALHDAIRDTVRQGIEEGAFVDIDPAFAQEMISAMNIANIRRYSGHARGAVGSIAQQSADFILRALLVDTADLGEIRSRAIARRVKLPDRMEPPQPQATG